MTKRDAGARRRAEAAGRRAEIFAGIYLRLKGFSIVARRYQSPGGEVDLIAKRGRLVIFVEVKARKTINEALYAVTTKTRNRVIYAASNFLTRRPDLAQCDMRYDIIAAAGWRLHHLPDAWRP